MKQETCLGYGWHLANTPPASKSVVKISFQDGRTKLGVSGFYDNGCWWLLIGSNQNAERAGDNEVFAWSAIEQ